MLPIKEEVRGFVNSISKMIADHDERPLIEASIAVIYYEDGIVECDLDPRKSSDRWCNCMSLLDALKNLEEVCYKQDLYGIFLKVNYEDETIMYGIDHANHTIKPDTVKQVLDTFVKMRDERTH